MKKLLTLFTLLLTVCSGAWGDEGDILFSQSFDATGAGSVAYAASTARSYTTAAGKGLATIVGSEDNMFTSIQCESKTKCGIGINSSTGGNGENWTGKFGAYYNNTGAKWSIIRTSNLAETAPEAVKITFDALLAVVDNGTSKPAVQFIVGSDFADGGYSYPENSKIYTGFGLLTGSSSSRKHAVCKIGSTTLVSNSEVIDYNTMKSFTWVINNTEDELTYTDPSGNDQTLESQKWDLWMGTTRIVTGVSRTTTGSSDFSGSSIQNIFIGSTQGVKHEFHIDNIVVTDLSPAPATPYTVTFNAGDYGTCATASLTEESAGAGVTLPAVTDNSKYTFNGWYTASTGGTKAGDAGDTYKPKADITLYAQYTATAITYNLNVGTSASTTIKSSTATNNDLITSVDIDQANATGDGAGATDPDRTTKLPIKTGANGADWDGDPTNYVLFKFTVADGYQFTLDDATIKIANVGSSSANNIKYKAVLSDGKESIETTYVCTTQDGTVETFNLENAGKKSFTGNVTLKLWAWKIEDISSGGSAFRMGTPLTISGYVTPESVSGTITESGWNTFSSNYALDLSTISDGTTAYVATSTSGSGVTLTKTTAIVEAGTGLMINGTAGEIFTINTTSDPATLEGTNLLVGLPNGGIVPVAEEGYNNYVFGWTVPAEPGFYLIATDEPTLGANKAYLHTTTPSGKLNIIIDDSTSQEEETDGIRSIENGRLRIENSDYYNLAGQRVGKDYKGIVIVNGKKMLNK